MPRKKTKHASESLLEKLQAKIYNGESYNDEVFETYGKLYRKSLYPDIKFSVAEDGFVFRGVELILNIMVMVIRHGSVNLEPIASTYRTLGLILIEPRAPFTDKQNQLIAHIKNIGTDPDLIPLAMKLHENAYTKCILLVLDTLKLLLLHYVIHTINEDMGFKPTEEEIEDFY